MVPLVGGESRLVPLIAALRQTAPGVPVFLAAPAGSGRTRAALEAVRSLRSPLVHVASAMGGHPWASWQSLLQQLGGPDLGAEVLRGGSLYRQRLLAALAAQGAAAGETVVIWDDADALTAEQAMVLSEAMAATAGAVRWLLVGSPVAGTDAPVVPWTDLTPAAGQELAETMAAFLGLRVPEGLDTTVGPVAMREALRLGQAGVADPFADGWLAFEPPAQQALSRFAADGQVPAPAVLAALLRSGWLTRSEAGLTWAHRGAWRQSAAAAAGWPDVDRHLMAGLPQSALALAADAPAAGPWTARALSLAAAACGDPVAASDWQAAETAAMAALPAAVNSQAGKLQLKIGKMYFYYQNAMSVALAHFDSARQHFEAAGADAQLVAIDSMIGWSLRNQGRRDEALAYSLQAYEAAVAGGLALEEGEAGHNLGNIYRELHDLPKAEDYFLRSIAAYERAEKSPPHLIARSKSGLAMVFQDMGRWDEATSLQQWCLDLVERFGLLAGMMTIAYHLGNCHLNTGRLDEAEGTFTYAARLSKDKGDVRRYGKCLEGLAKIAVLRGDKHLSLKHLREAAMLAADVGAAADGRVPILCDLLDLGAVVPEGERQTILRTLATLAASLPAGALHDRAYACLPDQVAGAGQHQVAEGG